MTASDLGAFLKARRGHVRPEDVDLPATGSRRVPGLRREEVALLAGVSVDYYARLEQGRERNPSPAVLNALATVLTLDGDSREHLFRLASLTPDAPSPRPPRVDPQLRELLNSWPHSPALIINRQLDVVVRNDLAEALYDGFEETSNLAVMTFLDPFGRTFFADWGQAAASCVANLRLALSHPGSAPDVHRVVARLHGASAEFARLWAQHHVRGKTHEAKSFRHPAVGDLTLAFHAFDVRGEPGHQLIVYRAASGSADAEKLALLGSLTVSVE